MLTNVINLESFWKTMLTKRETKRKMIKISSFMSKNFFSQLIQSRTEKEFEYPEWHSEHNLP